MQQRRGLRVYRGRGVERRRGPPLLRSRVRGGQRERERLANASTTANVVSTAANATLSVADPSATATGHLVNGTFSLPQPLQVNATSAGGTGGALTAVGGSASPTTLLTWSAPISNDAATVNFRQSVGANDALRTGTYGPPGTFATGEFGFGMLVADVIIDVFDPWFTGHHGDPALAARPHGLTSSGSTRSAGTNAVLETRLRTM